MGGSATGDTVKVGDGTRVLLYYKVSNIQAEAEAIAAPRPAPVPDRELTRRIGNTAKALVSALEAAVLLTASAPNRVVAKSVTCDETIAGIILGAIAVLIMDMTMVAMKTSTTTLAAAPRAMARL